MRSDLYTTIEHLTAISLQIILPTRTPLWRTPRLAIYTGSHTHTPNQLYSPPQSATHTQSQGTSVWLLCAIFWCDISPCVRIQCMHVCNQVCLCRLFSVKRSYRIRLAGEFLSAPYGGGLEIP